MKISRIQFYIALLIYLPFISVIIINSATSAYIFEKASFHREIFFGFLILSLVYSSFLVLFRRLSQKIQPYFVSLFAFVFLISLEAFGYISAYSAPDVMGVFNNFYAIQAISLFNALCAAAIITVFLLILMKIERNALIRNLIGLLAFSLLVPTGMAVFHRYQIDKFFGGDREGKIIFASTFNGREEPRAFYLSDRKFIKIQKQPIKGFAGSISPDKKYKVYAYSYDREDLSKIFIANLKTGTAVFLAQGEAPIWRE